jgi:hypothetical protein
MNHHNIRQLQAELAQFIGTTGYYRISNKTLLTDGTHYLAERALCYWLMHLFSSYLLELELEDWFVVLKLEIAGAKAKVTIEDGNDRILATQEIEYTDFAFPSITLYGCWDGENWVLMLPTEY